MTQLLRDILPKKPVLLMGAGPVPIPAEVASAVSLVISHLGEPMNTITGNIQKMSQYVFQTKTSKILGIAGPGSAAMEMAVTSLVYPGRKVLVLNQGTFSGRFAEMSRAVGGEVVELKPKVFGAFTVDEVKEALEKNQFDVLTIVQGETSCGVKNVYLPEICALAKSYGARVIVDTVCTLSTTPFKMDEWGIDIALTGGQKGLSATAGVSLIAFSEECFEWIEKRIIPIPHWCLDPKRGWKFWGKHEYHYTAPVNGILAMHEALRLVCEETLEKRFLRHETSAKNLISGLENMGLELFSPDWCRLYSVIAINYPLEIPVKKFISHMIQEHGVEISGAFGLNIFRIGQMGEQCRNENVEKTLRALKLTIDALKSSN